MAGDPAALRARCPTCGAELWRKRGGEWTLKAAILRLTPEGFRARCPAGGCHGEAPVPWLELGEPPPGRRLLVRRNP